LEHMDGDVGAVSQAITEVCTRFLAKPTMLMYSGHRTTV
jgi:hypothetical protein